LLRKLFPQAFVKQKQERKKGIKEHKEAVIKIEVEGLTNIETKLAKCCNPIKGEPIIAYITQKSGIKIHSQNCIYYQSGGLEQERLKPAKWSSESELQSIKIKLLGNDYSQMITAVVESASSEKMSIVSTEKKPSIKGYDCLEFEVTVKDIEQYNHYLTKLKKYSFIKSIK